MAPHLPVQMERRHDLSLVNVPLIVGGRPWDADAVLDCCPQAEAAGVSTGMRMSQAETLCPAACFVPAHEEAYRAAHDALTEAASHFTPTVETGRLGLLYAEVSGLERRFGPDAHLACQLAMEACQALRSGSPPRLPREYSRSGAPPRVLAVVLAVAGQASGLDVRVGIGGGKFVAEQAARAARPGSGCVVPPGEERAFLSPLPLSALPADLEMQRRLRLLGVRTLGALAALPRLAVVRQFGPHAGPLHDLARGIDPRPVYKEAPPLQLSRMRTFNDPLSDRAPLLAHADQMAAELAETLSRRGYQAEGFRLRLEEESGEEHAAGMPVKPPSAETGKLSRLAGRLLGRLTVAGPVTAFSLTVYPLRSFHLGATQLALFAGTPDSPLGLPSTLLGAGTAAGAGGRDRAGGGGRAESRRGAALRPLPLVGRLLPPHEVGTAGGGSADLGRGVRRLGGATAAVVVGPESSAGGGKWAAPASAAASR